MALPPSSLTEFLTNQTRKGFLEGRDGFNTRHVPSLFDQTLNNISAPPAITPDIFTITAVKVPIDTSGNNSPQTIPVQNWHSQGTIIEILEEYLNKEIARDEEQEKIKAYDRAMSIL
jgi:hypothetical protein